MCLPKQHPLLPPPETGYGARGVRDPPPAAAGIGDKMEPSPFNRRQWTSQSLKITAKELSLVNRNKSSALVERFSKYQKAAEEATAEKKRSSAENLPPHLRRGNLSVLKKKWENPALGEESGKETQRSSCAELRRKVGSPGAAGSSPTSPPGTEQNPGAGATAATRAPSGIPSQLPCPAGDSTTSRSHSVESGQMENCLREPREVEKPEGSESADSSGKIEKYSVPLNKLKMMFEKGEAAQSKVPREPRKPAGGRRISENSLSSEDFDGGQGEKSRSASDNSPALSPEKAESKKSLEMPRLTETSIKDRLAKYQAAVSKQGSSTGPSATSPDGKRLEGLSKQLDWDVRKIQRWFRQRRNQDKPTTLTKFCESMWRFTFYLSIFFYGLRFLWTAPWFWDTRQCWYNYPFQPLTSRLYYYYILELAFYWSLMFSQFTDIKRKDFLIMFVHHLATIGLITFSYMNNMVRVGTLVLCLHDASDFLLEAAKLANYAKYQRLCDAFFMLFGVVFIVTRLGIYPFWILNTTLFESWELIGPYPSWWLFNGLLVTLQVLHVFWSYLIVRTAYKALVRGKVSKDDRSDVESSSEEEDVTSNSTKGVLSTSSNGSNRSNGHVASGQWTEEE
ncbi:ceramide synthase 5 [Patagioenas fasciata monilis]|uniref:Ceramide synthase 5 n=1 Tax=Patagioenas fasciata monilis TaxID=372326 RepID=A0A1V4JCD6_PATFA|nr:ceramide synthase 5 [Patagioenas fasciata monilis]